MNEIAMGATHHASMGLRFVKRTVDGRELRILQQQFMPENWDTHEPEWRDVPLWEDAFANNPEGKL